MHGTWHRIPSQADRGTEPNEADPATCSHLPKKYYFTYKLSIHTKLFGFQEFRVLFVTTSEKRVKNMIEAKSAV